MNLPDIVACRDTRSVLESVLFSFIPIILIILTVVLLFRAFATHTVGSRSRKKKNWTAERDVMVLRHILLLTAHNCRPKKYTVAGVKFFTLQILSSAKIHTDVCLIHCLLHCKTDFILEIIWVQCRNMVVIYVLRERERERERERKREI